MKYQVIGRGYADGRHAKSLQQIVDYWGNDLRVGDIEAARKSGKDPVSRDGYRLFKSTTGDSQLLVREDAYGKQQIIPGFDWGQDAKVLPEKNNLLRIQDGGKTYVIVFDGKGGYSAIEAAKPKGE